MQRIGWRIPAAWLTLCIVWSSTWLAIKVGLRDLPPISFVAIRFLIAIVALSAVSVGRVRLLPLHRADYVVLALTGILMFAVNYTLLFWGELYVSSGLAAVLQATIPIFGMIFAHWMLPDEPLRLQKLAGAIIALGGVTLICGRLLGFNAPLLVLGFAIDGNPARFHWTAMSVFCLLYLAVIGSALTFLLLYWLLPRLTVAQLQSISLVTPPGAVMLGWSLGGETFPISSLLGAAFVLTGVWMIFRKREMQQPLIQE